MGLLAVRVENVLRHRLGRAIKLCKNYAFNLIFFFSIIYDLGSDGFSMQGKQIAANTAAVDSLDRTLDGT